MLRENEVEHEEAVGELRLVVLGADVEFVDETSYGRRGKGRKTRYNMRKRLVNCGKLCWGRMSSLWMKRKHCFYFLRKVYRASAFAPFPHAEERAGALWCRAWGWAW